MEQIIKASGMPEDTYVQSISQGTDKAAAAVVTTLCNDVGIVCDHPGHELLDFGFLNYMETLSPARPRDAYS